MATSVPLHDLTFTCKETGASILSRGGKSIQARNERYREKVKRLLFSYKNEMMAGFD